MNVLNQPALGMPRTPMITMLDALALLAILATFVLAVRGWQILPERVPHHFSWRGVPDAWGGRWVLFLLPTFGAVMFIGLSILGRFPHRFNYLQPITAENVHRQYSSALSLLAWLRLEIAALFLYVEWHFYKGALDKTLRLSAWFLPVVLTVVLGTIAAHIVIGMVETSATRG